MPTFTNKIGHCANLLMLSFYALMYTTPTLALENTDKQWLTTALKLQREIDLEAPFNEATFLGTHNSYNSKAYATYKRYPDPNQILSLTEQLNQGMRSLELDAHWALTSNLHSAILLCHSNRYVMCSLFDRKIEEGLVEIRHWLDTHPHEVVLLYIERFLENHEPRLASLLEVYLGPYIYHTPVPAGSTTCAAIPSHLTKAEILARGKQLIIITKGCYKPAADSQVDAMLNQLVFAGSGTIPTLPSSFIDAQVNYFKPAPDCGAQRVFGADPEHTSLWRIYEDQTWIGRTIKGSEPLTVDAVKAVQQCPINWIGFDMLKVEDERLAAAIWSWAPGYPQSQAGQCALYQPGVGIVNQPCTTLANGYVCREQSSHQLQIIAQRGNWQAGETSCQTLGASWHYSMPINGKEMATVEATTTPLTQPGIWLNYTLTNQQWQANVYYHPPKPYRE